MRKTHKKIFLIFGIFKFNWNWYDNTSNSKISFFKNMEEIYECNIIPLKFWYKIYYIYIRFIVLIRTRKLTWLQLKDEKQI